MLDDLDMQRRLRFTSNHQNMSPSAYNAAPPSITTHYHYSIEHRQPSMSQQPANGSFDPGNYQQSANNSANQSPSANGYGSLNNPYHSQHLSQPSQTLQSPYLADSNYQSALSQQVAFTNTLPCDGEFSQHQVENSFPSRNQDKLDRFVEYDATPFPPTMTDEQQHLYSTHQSADLHLARPSSEVQLQAENLHYPNFNANMHFQNIDVGGYTDEAGNVTATYEPFYLPDLNGPFEHPPDQAHFNNAHHEDYMLPTTGAALPEQQAQAQGSDIPGAPPRRKKKQAAATSTPNRGKVKVKKPCTEKGCTRGVKPPSQRLCGRHLEKWLRNNAAPPVFKKLDDIDSFQTARDKVYPHVAKLELPNDDCDPNFEEYWIQQFIQAANEPYQGGSPYDEFHASQQIVFNGKQFEDEPVNVRMRLLFQEAVVLHQGGQVVYPVGGDNDGYGKADSSLRFSERLHAIIHFLRLDKRICMDVIEGRGVSAFVANPAKYEKRKTQNKDSNAKKQEDQKRGKQAQQEMNFPDDVNAYETPASMAVPLDSDPDQEYDPDQEAVQPTTGSNKRMTRSSTRGGRRPSKRQKKTADPPLPVAANSFEGGQPSEELFPYHFDAGHQDHAALATSSATDGNARGAKRTRRDDDDDYNDEGGSVNRQELIAAPQVSFAEHPLGTQYGPNEGSLGDLSAFINFDEL